MDERGYSERFGLHYVDFNDPARTRTPKDSAKFYTKLITDNGFKPEPKEKTIYITRPGARSPSDNGGVTTNVASCYVLVLTVFFHYILKCLQ